MRVLRHRYLSARERPPVGNRPPCSGSGPCQATCDGVNGKACAAWPGGDVVCGIATCADGWLTTSACGGNGSCAPTTANCAPFGCDASGTACAAGCTSHDQCPGASHCVAGACVADNPLGAACAEAAECQHGYCANGVCCNEPCTGDCRVCGADGFSGPAADNATCSGGVCCDGDCVDTSSDGDHCGGCGQTCLGDMCQSAVCAGGICTRTPHPGTIDCDDGLACTVDTCDPAVGCLHTLQPGFCLIGGTCHAGGTRNPANPCQVCDPARATAAWSNAPQGVACDDATLCNGREACNGSGQCVAGIPVSCAPPLPCQKEGVCHQESGECSYALKDEGEVCRQATSECQEDAVCDGVSPDCPATHEPKPAGTVCHEAPTACDEDAVCDGETFVCPDTPPTCDDGLACTTDSCDSEIGCQHQLQPGFCLIRDVGAGGQHVCYAAGASHPTDPCFVCDPSNFGFEWSARPDGTYCGGEDRCTEAATCQSGACTIKPAVVCEQPSQLCREAVCDPETGDCVVVDQNDDIFRPVGGRKACMRCSLCVHGTCNSSPVPVDCSLGGLEPCLTCDPETDACVPLPLGTDCGSTCDTRRTCNANGECAAGVTIPGSGCVGIGCQSLVCDPETRQCVETGANDGMPCGGDPCRACHNGTCAPKTCGACKKCDPATGQCVDCNGCCNGVCDAPECGSSPPVIQCCNAGDVCMTLPSGVETCCPAAGACTRNCCSVDEKCCGTILDLDLQPTGVCCPVNAFCCEGIGHIACCAQHQACTIFGCTG